MPKDIQEPATTASGRLLGKACFVLVFYRIGEGQKITWNTWRCWGRSGEGQGKEDMGVVGGGFRDSRKKVNAESTIEQALFIDGK